MKIVFVRPNQEELHSLEVLLDIHFMEEPMVKSAKSLSDAASDSSIAICSDKLTEKDAAICRNNYRLPVIMLSKQPPETLIKAFNVYRATDQAGHNLVHFIKDGLSAKETVDSFLNQQKEMQSVLLEEILAEEAKTAEINTGKPISTFEALYTLIEQDRKNLFSRMHKDIQNMRIGLANTAAELKPHLDDALARKGFKACIKDIELADWNPTEYDLIISSNPPFGRFRANNYRTPVLLLRDLPDAVTQECLRDWNVYRIISPSDEKRVLNESISALQTKFELDRLMLSFKQIAEVITQNQRISQEQEVIQSGNYEESADEGIGPDRGPPRPISRFEAAYLIAAEEVERMVQQNKDIPQAKIFSFYTDLFRETKIREFLRKSLVIWRGAKSKHLKDWLQYSMDSIKEYPDAAAKLLAQYYTQNPADPDIVFARHRHNIIKFKVKATDTEHIVKFSEKEAMAFLKKEEALLKEFNDLNRAISEKIGKTYVHIPEYVSSYFPDEESKKEGKQDFNFLLFHALKGQPACAVINSYEKRKQEAPEPEQDKIEAELYALAEKILREKSKIGAMAYMISSHKPELLERLHSTSQDNAREYYKNKIQDTFIASGRWEKDYPEFYGGLKTLLEKDQVQAVQQQIFDNIDVLLDIVTSAAPGVMTDRSLRNSLISEDGTVCTIDFETLRDLPTLFDIASTLEMGLADNYKNRIIESDVHVCGQKVYASGKKVSQTQYLLAVAAKNLEQELRTVGFDEGSVNKYMQDMVPEFREYEKQYYACAAVIDMIGFGVSVRNIFAPGKKDSEINSGYHNAVNAGRFFKNCSSNILALKRFYSDTESLDKLDNLKSAFGSIEKPVLDKLEKWQKQ